MKWTQTLLFPKSISKVDWVEDELVKIINGYDPGGYKQTYVSIDWNDKKDFDMQDAVNMIGNTNRDFNRNLEYMSNGYKDGNNMYEFVRCAHQMDLLDNFLSNWLIGYSSYNPYIGAEFIPIWNGKILDDYLKEHNRAVYSVPMYMHV